MLKLDFLFDRKLWMPGWGEIALSSFLLALASGLIIIPFVPAGENSYQSLSQFVGSSFLAHFIHGFHSYSGDIFLISSFMHILEYLYKKAFLSYQLTSWFWLVLLGIISIFTVFSGFLSVGSKESLSAIQIFRNILTLIPLAGEFSSAFLFGNRPVPVIYLHHGSTFSILSIILLYIHLRRIKAEKYALYYTTVLTLLIAVLLPAGIGHMPDSVSAVIKGPWYFIGLQEMLGWAPTWLAGLIYPFIILLLFSSLPHLSKHYQYVIWIILALIVFYFVEATIGTFFRGSEWQLLFR